MTQPSRVTLPPPARRALDAYRQRLAAPGDDRPVTVAWAPGRVNLIGEHTDYNEGFVLPVAVDRVVALAGRPSASGDMTRLYSVHHDATTAFPATRDALTGPRPDIPAWARYVRGVLAELAALPAGDFSPSPSAPAASLPLPPNSAPAPSVPRGSSPAPAPSVPRTPFTPRFAAAISGDVPLGGGLSSSAALEVATATFAAAIGGPSLPPMETALLCQRTEHNAVGVLCGIMDQAASCLGRPDAAILLDCRSLDHRYVPANLPGVALALFDTNVPHTLAESGYNERRRQCDAAVALLTAAIQREEPDRRVRSLRDITADDLAEHAADLPDVLLRRARHVVAENERALLAAEALAAGDAETLGTLLLASHASLRDDYEVSCPELDAAVEIAAAVPGVYGARMMGAGFGGSALILARVEALPALEAALERDYPARAARAARAGSFSVCRVAGGPASVTRPVGA